MENEKKTAEELLEIIEEKDQKIAELERNQQWLMDQFRLLKRKQYGTSTEQSDEDQLRLFNEVEAYAPELPMAVVKGHKRKSTRLTTDKLPEDLPVEIIEHELPEEERVCPDCNGNLHVMGKETRDELKVIPAKAVIVRHVRNVYACRACEESSDHVPVLKADMPEPVIKGSFAHPSTIAHVAVQKFTMASPLYRQEQEWKGKGIKLSRQTMSNWLMKASDAWLMPIYEEMKKRLCQGQVLHADETTLQVLLEPGKKAQSKSYMWLYRTSGDARNPIVLYEYQPDRKHTRPEEFLKQFTGYIHTDGYLGYHKLPEGITVVGCWAHLRRKMYEAKEVLPKDNQADSLAAKGLAYCDMLFHLEKTFAPLAPQERHKKRQEQSLPLVNEFFGWIEKQNALPKTTFGTAVGYAISQRKYLERYLLDGRLEISNNRAERSIKPFVIGRKNWLFANTPNGAKTSAVYYSLIISAAENGLNPFEYLSWVLEDAPNLGKPGYADSLDDLLPTNGSLPKRLLATRVNAEPEKYSWEED